MSLRAVMVVLAASLPALAAGHAVVTPAVSGAGQAQQYTLHVPNEKNVPTTTVKLLFPPEVVVNNVEAPEGWQLAIERDAQGRIASATWTGSLPPKSAASFVFSARNPAAAATAAWIVMQTYEGNLVVEWNGPPSSKTPASRTEIR